MAFNILVVDDSKTIRAIIKKTLGLAKLEIDEIYEAENGRQALDCLKETCIDLVMSDLNMPEMSGIELVDAMSRDNTLNTIPIIVISTDGSSTRIEELKRKGVREYLRKPFTPESVGDLINKVLGVTVNGS